MKHWTESKTVIFSLLLALLGFIDANSDLIKGVAGDKYHGYIILVSGIISLVLRVVTTQSITVKK